MFEPKCTYSVFALCEEDLNTTYQESCNYECFQSAQEEVERLSNLGYLVKTYIFKPVLVDTTQPVEKEDEFEENDNYEQQEWDDLYPPNDDYFY